MSLRGQTSVESTQSTFYISASFHVEGIEAVTVSDPAM